MSWIISYVKMTLKFLNYCISIKYQFKSFTETTPKTSKGSSRPKPRKIAKTATSMTTEADKGNYNFSHSCKHKWIISLTITTLNFFFFNFNSYWEDKPWQWWWQIYAYRETKWCWLHITRYWQHRTTSTKILRRGRW